MNKLKINTWNGILSIVNCFLFAASWFFIIGAAFDESFNGGGSLNSTATFFYAMAWIGVVVSIVALYKSKKASISIVGPLLCLLGNLAFGLAAAFAFPAIVLLIIGTVLVSYKNQLTKIIIKKFNQSQSLSDDWFLLEHKKNIHSKEMIIWLK